MIDIRENTLYTVDDIIDDIRRFARSLTSRSVRGLNISDFGGKASRGYSLEYSYVFKLIGSDGKDISTSLHILFKKRFVEGDGMKIEFSLWYNELKGEPPEEFYYFRDKVLQRTIRRSDLNKKAYSSFKERSSYNHIAILTFNVDHYGFPYRSAVIKLLKDLDKAIVSHVGVKRREVTGRKSL